VLVKEKENHFWGLSLAVEEGYPRLYGPLAYALWDHRPQFFAPMTGTKLAHYEITSHLGTGGMGEVYRRTSM